MINLKQKLKENKKSIGSWLTIANPIVAEIMSKHFDWLVIDAEHSAIGLSQIQDLVRIIELNDCFPLVRVSENNPTLIKRVMDTGAKGIIIPMVNSKEDAQRALNAVRYPPEGIRGVGLARAQNYGFSFKEYQKTLKNDVVVIAQIEHVDAVNNLESILKTDIDGIIIGPYDISASLGKPGKFDTTKYKNCLNTILIGAEMYKKSLGIHVIPPYGKHIKNLDNRYTFIAFSLDTLFFGTKIKDELLEIGVEPSLTCSPSDDCEPAHS